MTIKPGTEVRLGGRTVPPFNGLSGYVKAVFEGRLLVLVTVDGERREIAVATTDVAVLRS